MSESTALVTTDAAPIMSIPETKAHIKTIQRLMKDVMEEGLDKHYGIIPGCKKPSLLKPGAEILCLTFNLGLETEITSIDLPHGHREYTAHCRLFRRATGEKLGDGWGSCTTLETKYRFRQAELTCPECGKQTIIKGKQEYGGGWVCFRKKGGCGAKFKDGDKLIENQEMGRVEHDNPADNYNTCLKISKKRGFVDSVLTALGASEVFTQDVEGMNLDHDADAAGDEQTAKSAPRRRQTPTQAATGKTKEEVQAELDDARRNEAMNNQHFGTYTITEGRKREGISNGKPWTLFRFKTEEGEEFQTFDGTLSDVCRNARDLGEQVKITFTKEVNGKFTNNVIQDVEILGGDETGEIIDGEDNPF